MGVFDDLNRIRQGGSSTGGSASVRTLDDVLRQQMLAIPREGARGPAVRTANVGPTRSRPLPRVGDISKSGGQEPGGWQGFLADIMNSIPGKIILKAGEIISLPGRAVTSAVNEFRDALDSDPNTVATWNDFGRQIADLTFGFGTVIGDLTGMKWVDRVLGFAGDLALDPLIYLTLGASRAARVVDAAGEVKRGARTLSIASQDGRLALANKIRELGASDELTKAVARRGRAALRGPTGLDLLEKAGYDRAGLYWFGKRLPMSARVGEALETGLSNLRVWSGDHIFNKVGSLFTVDDMRDLRKAIARGQAPAADVGAFMDMVLSRNVERADAAAGLRQAKSMRETFLGGLSQEDVNAARSTAYRYLDVGGPPISATTPEGRVASEVQKLLEQMYKNVEGAAKAVDDAVTLGKVPQSYFPHMATDDAFKWLSNGNDPRVVHARGQVFNPFDNSGSWKARMVAGDTIGEYTLTQADIDGGIDALNKIFRREYEIDFDFFETDLGRVLDRYDEMYATMMGKIGRKKFLTDRGTFQIVEKRLEPIPEVQELLQKQLKANFKSRQSKQRFASKKLKELVGSIDNVLSVSSRGLQAEIAQAGKNLVEATRVEAWTSYSKSKMVQEIRSAAEDLRSVAGTFRSVQDSVERSPLVTFLDQEQDSIIEELDMLANDIELNNLMETLGPEGVQNRAMEIARKIEEFSSKEEEILKKANVLADHFEEILGGKDIEGNKRFSQRMRSAFTSGVKEGEQGRLTGQKLIKGKVQGAGKPFVEIDGAEYRGVESRGWWKRVNKYNPVKSGPLAKRATKKEITRSIQRTIRGSVGIDEMRNLGMIVAATLDTLPEGALSDAARENFENLLKALEDADRSSQYYKQLSMARRNRRNEVVIGQVKNNYNIVESSIETELKTYFAASSMLQEVFSDIDLVAQADTIVPGERIYTLLQDDRFSGLDYILGRYADDTGRWSEGVDSFESIGDLFWDPVAKRVDEPYKTFRYELRGEGGSGSAVTRSQITYGELEGILTKAISESKGRVHDLKLETNTIFDGVLPVRPKDAPTTIRVADLIDEIYSWADSRGIAGVPNSQNVADFVNERFWQRYKPWVEAIEASEGRTATYFDVEGAAKVNKEINLIRSGEAPATGAEKTVSKRSTERLQQLGEAQVRLAQATDPDEIKILQKAVNDLQKAEYGDIPQRGRSLNKSGRSDTRGIRGLKSQEEATERFLQTVDDSLRPDDVLSVTDAETKLRDVLLKTFFENEIESRWKSIVSLMAVEGLVPGEDLYRLVINAVGREFSQSSEQAIQEGVRAARKIDEIIDLVGGNVQRKNELKNIISNPPKTAVGDDDISAVLKAQSELAGLNSSQSWVGREHELYATIVKMLGESSPDGTSSWITRVTEANGRHDAQSLYAEMNRLGGTKGQTGIPNQRKKLVQDLKKAASPQEKEAIQMKLDALPDDATLKKMRDDFYNKRAIPWYRRNIDSPVGGIKRSDVESALQAIVPYATAGGKLSPDATVDEMLEWLNITSKNLRKSNEQVRKSFAWTLEASDPFLDVTRFKIGASQNIPSIYIEGLLYNAKLVDAQRLRFEEAEKFAQKQTAKMEEQAVAAKQAERLLKGMDQPRGQFAGLVSEDDVPYFKETRKMLIRLAEMKNNINTPGKPLYVASLERKELNDLVSSVIPYVFSQDTGLVYIKDVNEVAIERIKNGLPVYKKRRAGNPSEIRKMQQLAIDIKQAEIAFADAGRNFDIPTKLDSQGRIKVDYASLEGTGLVQMRKTLDEMYKEYDRLIKRNPENFEAFVPVTKTSDIEDGFMYFYPKTDSAYSMSPNMVEEEVNAIKQLFESGDANANARQRLLSDSMTPIRAQGRQELKIDGQQLVFGPNDVNALFNINGTVEKAATDAALQKMSFISKAIKDGKITKDQFLKSLQYTARENSGTVFYANDALRSMRSDLIDKIWEATPEKAWLDEVAAFEQSINLGKWNAKVTNANRALNTAHNLRLKASEARGVFDDKGARFGYEVDTVKFGQAIASGMSPAEARKFATVAAKKPVTGAAGAKFVFDEAYSGLESEIKKLDVLFKGQYSASQRFQELTNAGSTYRDAISTIGKEVAELRPLDQNFVKINESIQDIVENGEKLNKELGFLKSNSLKIQRIGELEYQLQRIRDIRKDRISEELRKTQVPEILGDMGKRMIRLNNDLADLSLKYDQAKLLRLNAVEHHNIVVPRLQRQVDIIENARERLQTIAKGDNDLMAKNAELELWLEESKELLEEAGSVIVPGQKTTDVAPTDLLEQALWMQKKLKDRPDTRVYTKDYEKYLMLKTEYMSAVQDFILRDNSYKEASRVMENLSDFDWAVAANDAVEEGMKRLDKIGLPSYKAKEEIAKIAENMQQFIQPEFVRGINRFIGGYTGFFKAYATSTPGFVVRNTMTNTFMLVGGGASPRNMIEGLGLYRSWREALANNTEETFLKELSDRGGDVREIFDLAVRASDASGYGRSGEAMGGWNPKRMKLKDNRYTRFHKKWNQASEGSARFIMAYDSAVKGDDFFTAAARVKKFFFDYEDISAADEALRSVIPFWYWMSRNIPLQITNRWANPKAYLLYDKIMKNIRSEDQEEGYLPSWMVTVGATKLGDGVYLTPDLGFNAIEEDVRKLASPLSGEFFDYVNPGLRVPVELLTNRRLRYGGGFREEGQQVAAGPFSPAVQALAGILGPFSQTRETATGEPGVTEKFNYATQALLPMLGQSERILPASDRGRQNRTNAWLSYLGVPIRTVTQEDRAKERQRQIYEQRDLQNRNGG